MKPISDLQPKIKTSVALPQDLHARVRAWASARRRSMSWAVREMLELALVELARMDD